LDKSDIDMLLWYRSQTFWTTERETAIFDWLSYNHEQSIAAREYERICRKPISLPSSASVDEKESDQSE
jgi:hypothetical protein